MQFLVDQFDTGLLYRTITTLRPAISTTHPDIGGSPVGSHPLVSQLLRCMFNSQPHYHVTPVHGKSEQLWSS